MTALKKQSEMLQLKAFQQSELVTWGYLQTGSPSLEEGSHGHL